MNNYDFCAQWVLRQGIGLRVLDYGCGAGEVVKLLRSEGVQAFGCETFYSGGDTRNAVGDLLGTAILPMEDGRIPFPDQSFDIVLSNAVLEHVEDLGAVLSEIARVTKPSGRVLSVFPSRDTWREGHSGVPFLHWFPKGSELRVYYAALMHRLGFGYHRQKWGTPMQWARHKCEWLDRWVVYRSLPEIHAAFSAHLGPVTHIEDTFLQERLGSRARLVRWLSVPFQQLVVRKLGELVFTARLRSSNVVE